MISFLMYKQSVAVDVKVWNRTSNTYIDLTSLAYNLPTIVFIKTYVISDYVRKKKCVYINIMCLHIYAFKLAILRHLHSFMCTMYS